MRLITGNDPPAHQDCPLLIHGEEEAAPPSNRLDIEAALKRNGKADRVTLSRPAFVNGARPPNLLVMAETFAGTRLCVLTGLLLLTLVPLQMDAQAPISAQPPADVTPSPSADLPRKEKIQLHFEILESGGIIDFTTRDANDTVGRDALRVYGKKLEQTLRSRQFDLLFVFLPANSEFVNWMAKNSGLGFSVLELPSGIRLDITSSSQAARTAVHEFIRQARGNTPFTAEEKRRNHPGIDLGRDAEPVHPKE